MPWTGASFRTKHAHDLTDGQANTAARIANGILKSGGDEGVAIATAIKRAKQGRGPHRMYGKGED